MESMLIKLVGKRSFQVQRDKVLSACRTVNDNMAKKLCYLDPGYDYEVEAEFGEYMIKKYPMDFVGQNKINKFPEPKVATKEPKAAEVKEPVKANKKKKG